MTELVRFEVEAGVALITIDRPPVNALSAQTLTELEAAVAKAGADDSVKAVVIRGGGSKAFVAGADIAEFPTLAPEQAVALAQRGQKIFDAIQALPKPVIAAVQGFALGGGCELAMACDLRVATESAKFGQPEINLGIIPGYGGTQRLARLVGPSRAKYLCLTGDMIGAQEASRIGLVDVVVPDAELLETAKALAAKLASKAPVAMALIKRAVDAGLQGSLAQGLELEARLFGKVFGTADATEGVSAFLAKRAPNFQGK